MSQENNFYVDLPSNGSSHYYPSNTTGSYNNYLADSIRVDGKWEVALVEIKYPYTWKLLEKDSKIGLYILWDDDWGEWKSEILTKEYVKTNYPHIFQPGFAGHFVLFKVILSNGYEHTDVIYEPDGMRKTVDYLEVTIPAGYYHSPFHLAMIIKEQINFMCNRMLSHRAYNRNTTEPIDIKFDTTTNQIKFQSPLKDCKLMIFKESEELNRILGFDLPERYFTLPIPSQSIAIVPLLVEKTPSLYIYSDIVEDVYVGDSKVPLLRTVPIQGVRGQNVTITFHKPFYKPLAKVYINSILIEVKDDTGKEISFTSGKVICTLHFRKCP